MAKITRLADHRPIEARRMEWLERYPNRFLVCRGNGHDFPKLLPGKALVRTRLEPWHDPTGERQGCYLIEQRCRNCGRLRWRITGPPGAFYIDSTKWKYEDPKGYGTPPGLGIPRGEYLELYFSRLILGEQDLEEEISASEQERRQHR